MLSWRRAMFAEKVGSFSFGCAFLFGVNHQGWVLGAVCGAIIGVMLAIALDGQPQ